jgi:hypothetical protein
MTQHGNTAALNMPRAGEGIALAERISHEFSERFARLESLQNAAKVTQKDRVFLDETQAILADVERRNTGALEEGPASILASFRVMLDVAEDQFSRADYIEADEARPNNAKPELQKEVERREVEPPSFDEEVETPESGDSSTAELSESGFENDEDAQLWFEAVRDLEEMLNSAEAADPVDRHDAVELAHQEYNAFVLETYNPNLDTIENSGYTVEDYPFLKVVGTRLDRLAERFEHYFSVQSRFFDKLEQLDDEINRLLAMPIGTAEEVADARAAFDALKLTIGVRNRGVDPKSGYMVDWRQQISPILDGFKARKQRWDDSWKELVQWHKYLMDRFFGPKPEEGEERNGVLQAYGRQLRERSREIRQEAWQNEFPNFQLAVAKTIINIQDARMRQGDERLRTMIEIASTFSGTEEHWKVLRSGGPRISHEDRAKGERSAVNQYDYVLRSLARDITVLEKAALKARPTRLNEAAYLWRGALARTDVFWKPNVDYREKEDFLIRYGSGEVEEAEMAEMLRSIERENFETVAQSDVLDDLRARGEVKRERRAAIEREERRRLYHPALEMYRMEARNAYHNAIQHQFKPDVPLEVREHIFSGKESVEDDVLREHVKDLKSCRLSLSVVNNLYARAKNVEDQLYTEGKVEKVKMKAKSFRLLLDRHAKFENDEVFTWKHAKFADGWGIPPAKRADVLHYEFSQFWNFGEKTFEEIPPRLQEPIRQWVFSRRNLRIMRQYIQWLIDENPTLAQAATNMPTVFSVPEKESPVDDESSDNPIDSAGGEITDADKADLVLPKQEARAGDEAGGGEFGESEDGAVLDAVSREVEVGEEQESGSVEPAGEVVETNPEGREAALEESGNTIVRALI